MIAARLVRSFLHDTAMVLRRRSLRDALEEQDLASTVTRLRSIVPDISQQFTTHVLSDYGELKARGQHAFQMHLFELALRQVADRPSLTVVDIGDSAGTHLRYVKALTPVPVRTLSVNLDPVAVEKIRALGLEAVCSRAEEILQFGISADVFLCLETLEHLRDPASFLHDLAVSAKDAVLVLTVPYQFRSRVGLEYIRSDRRSAAFAEDTHILELSPEDWKLIFKYAGWKIIHERIYYQYPRHSWLRPMQFDWRRADFEGFFGVVLAPDFTWSERYKSW